MAQQPVEETPPDIKPFMETVSPAGSRPPSSEFGESGPSENLPDHSTLHSGATSGSNGEKLQSETGSSERPASNTTPEAVPEADCSSECPESTCVVGASSVSGGGPPANHAATADATLQNSSDGSSDRQQDLTGHGSSGSSNGSSGSNNGSSGSNNRSSGSNNRQQGLIGSSGTINLQPVAETSRPGEKCLAKIYSPVTKTIPFPECRLSIRKEDLKKHSITCAQGKHKNVKIMVTMYTDVTDTSPPYSRKGRAIFEIKVPKKDPNFEYRLSLMYVNLFDPEEETNLTDLAEAKAEGIPLDEETVTLYINLGEGLLENIEKSKAKELELQFKIQLHLEEKIYGTRDCYLSSSGSSYVDIVRHNQLQQ